MGNEQLERFADFFTIKRYTKATVIYKEKELGDEFYVVVDGEVDLTALDTTGQEQYLCTKKEGDFFGERAVLSDNVRREATATTDRCTVLALTRKKMQQFLATASSEMKDLLSRAMGEEMTTFLKKIEFLASLHEWELQLLAGLFRFKNVEAEEKVFEEGDLGRQMYIVSKGSVKVTARDEKQAEIIFTMLGAGAYFGEIALLVDMPRTATITACEKCLLLELGVEDFHNFLNVVPDLKEKFVKVAKERTSQLLRKFNVPFFDELPPDKFDRLAELCEIQQFPHNTVVFSEEQPGDKFFLTIYGELSVTKEGKGEIGRIKAGRYFGEIALVTDSPRQATITTVTKCVLLSLTREHFESFFSDTPDAYAEFAIKLFRNQAPLQAILRHKTGRKYFSEHLAQEYSSENLEFWDAVNEYEALDPEDRKTLEEGARRINEAFIDVKSERQVNIPAEKRLAVTTRMHQGEITPALFAEAKGEVFKLMSADSFKRFKSSDRFAKLFQEIGVYDVKFEEEKKDTRATAATTSDSGAPVVDPMRRSVQTRMTAAIEQGATRTPAVSSYSAAAHVPVLAPVTEKLRDSFTSGLSDSKDHEQEAEPEQEQEAEEDSAASAPVHSSAIDVQLVDSSSPRESEREDTRIDDDAPVPPPDE